jgi:hypothetical protein
LILLPFAMIRFLVLLPFAMIRFFAAIGRFFVARPRYLFLFPLLVAFLAALFAALLPRAGAGKGPDFYAAAANVIPLLLIAYLVEARSLLAWNLERSKDGDGLRNVVAEVRTRTIAITLTAALGEALALIALASNSTSFLMAGSAISLATIGGVLLQAVLSWVKPAPSPGDPGRRFTA